MGSTEADISTDSLASFHVASKTDVGMRREENQDYLGVVNGEDYRLYIVADGMGGVQGGAIASKLAVDVVKAFLNDRQNVRDPDIVCAIGTANQAIYERGLDEPTLSGMGTTFVALCFREGRLSVFNVGDSRAYLFRNGQATQLTNDHTLISELLKTGAIEEDQVENHPVAHMLTRSLGPSSEIEIDCNPVADSPLPQDRYLLCSDGLYNHLSLSEIAEVVENTDSLEQVSERLVEMANERGGSDNITVMVISVSDAYSIDPLAVEALSAASENGHEAVDDSGYDYMAVPSLDSTEDEDQETFEQDQEAPLDRSAADEADTLENIEQPDKVWEDVFPEANSLDEENPEIKSSVDDLSSEQLRQRLEANQSQASFREQPRPTVNIRLDVVKMLLVIAGVAIGVCIAIYWSASSGQRNSIALSGANLNESDSAPVVAPQVFQGEQQEVTQRSNNETEQPDGSENEQVNKELKEDGLDYQAAVTGNAAVNDESQGEEKVDNIRVVRNRLAELHAQEKLLEAKLNSFDKPVSGTAGKLLKNSNSKVQVLKKQIDEIKNKKDSIKDSISVWYGQSQRLKGSKLLPVANEIAAVLPIVLEKKSLFEEISWKFLKAREELKFDPDNKELKNSIDDLVRERKAALNELENAVERAISEKTMELNEESSRLDLEEERIQDQLREAEVDLEYAQALVTQDPEQKAKSIKDMTARLEAISTERKSLESLLEGMFADVDATL